MPRILNQSQAEAIYSAMCALNNLGSTSIELDLPGDIWIQAGVNGGVIVCPRHVGAKLEQHASQAAFAAAYGLDGKEPRTAEYTPGVGWQVVTKTGRRGNFDTEAQALAA
ncbi:hypothetical protein [Diaphorobacter sp. J5-51]|uniref:hypothetical protein n=1 Tax=Diaphorobacter sp. J5-51 TaxID=680496 RepID=UPI000643521B|nr:hypothetical protein [Diaphorobacter sp. J5-51]KLR58005.1 hypothetical protein OX89_09320 [Diaphorobacter sp. J5-51]